MPGESVLPYTETVLAMARLHGLQEGRAGGGGLLELGVRRQLARGLPACTAFAGPPRDARWPFPKGPRR